MAKYQDWLEPERLILIEGWARNGLTEKQIAENCGIGYATLKEWKKRFPAFSAALKKGREVVDREVENALLKRATGYEIEEITQEINGDKKMIKKVKKHVAGDVTAQIFWLKHRRTEWRDNAATGDSDTLKRAKDLLGGINSVIE